MALSVTITMAVTVAMTVTVAMSVAMTMAMAVVVRTDFTLTAGVTNIDTVTMIMDLKFLGTV